MLILPKKHWVVGTSTKRKVKWVDKYLDDDWKCGCKNFIGLYKQHEWKNMGEKSIDEKTGVKTLQKTWVKEAWVKKNMGENFVKNMGENFVK